MKVIKPQRLAVLTRTYEYEGRFYLAVNTMAFFTFGQPQRLLSEVSMWKFVATAMGKDAVLDMGMPKQRGEFLVYGKCHAPRGEPAAAVAVRVKVGAQEKKLLVLGDRRWKKIGPISTIGEPQPFTVMDLDYSKAFGGPDFPRNPLGKGMPPAQDGEPRLLPNIENPARPVALPDDRPEPAGLGPIDLTWPQRFSKVGTYDDHWLKTRFPGFAADMDWSLFNAAPQDQWLPGFFAGDEAFEVAGMHPEEAVLRGKLPGCAVRCLVTQKTNGQERVEEVPTRAETLVLFPGAQRGILLFRGVMEITTDDGADIANLLVGAEEAAAPRPLAYYKDLLALRLDKKQGAVHALNDGPLLPPMPESNSAGDAASEDDGMDALVRSKGLHRQNLRRRAERILAESKQKIAKLRAELIEIHQAHALPPPDLTDIDRGLAMTMPPDPPVPTLEEMPAFKAEMEQVLEKARMDGLAKKAEAEAHLREVCKQQKLDYDEVVAAARRKGSGPPEPIAQKTMKQLLDTQAELKAQNVSSPELEGQLADPELPKKLQAADASMMDSYRKNAHLSTEAPALAESDAARLKQEVQDAFARGENFRGRDFTGADFSGLNLAGADFSEALMEGVDFSGADLGGANFSQAVLARGNFGGAKLGQAIFSGANLGFSKLGSVQASAADFSGAVLAGADLSKANFSRANLAGCDLMGARLAGANMSGVSAAGAKFIQIDLKATEANAVTPDAMPDVDLTGLQFAGADLTKAIFLQCQMDGADFSGARLGQAIFLTAAGSQVNFSGADLENMRVVKDSRLDRSDFTGAKLKKANLRGTDLSGSVFAGADLTDADLSETRLARADLRKTDAAGVRLGKADLSGADFSGANLRQAVLQKSDLRGTVFLGASLFMADMLRVVRDEKTIFERANMKKTLLKGTEKS
jgi:uncharacterized protein YjbI with pentapeptide repeats